MAEAAASLAAAEAAELEAALMAADPEAAFLLRHRLRPRDDEEGVAATTCGFEWETYKENVRSLKRGRNVQLLNKALRSQADPDLRASLIRTRRRMIEAIDEYQGEDPLQPWLECIKWVQESFPSGGECSGLVVMYEQCVRTFWHDERYREDLRYLKVWMEYAENCADAEVIFNFLEANEIGQSHSIFYTLYAKHLETKNKFRKADEIFNLGLARNAKPLEKLEAAYRAFLVRSTEKKHENEDDVPEGTLPARSFGTIITTESRRTPAENPGICKRTIALQRIDTNRPLSIYKDENSKATDHPLRLKKNEKSWNNLGSRSDRNKENASVPEKWASYKVPRTHMAGSAATSAHIEVYVDEECAGLPSGQTAKKSKSSTLKLRKASSQNLKRETEMLKDNPLRNFPANNSFR